MNKAHLSEKSQLLYRDIIKAEIELDRATKYSITLTDLEEVRELQLEVVYRKNLFDNYIENIDN